MELACLPCKGGGKGNGNDADVSRDMTGIMPARLLRKPALLGLEFGLLAVRALLIRIRQTLTPLGIRVE